MEPGTDVVYLENEKISYLFEITKPIWSKMGTVSNQDWLIFHDGLAYCFNGYFFFSMPVDFKDSFLLPAVQTTSILKKNDLEITYTNDSVKIISGKSQVESKYPFKIKDQLLDFYSEENTNPLSVDGERLVKALNLCAKTLYIENIEFSNTYSKNNTLCSTDSYRITAIPCDIQETTIPVLTNIHLFDNPVAYCDNDSTVSFFFKNGAILSVLKNIGDSKKVYSYIPKVIPKEPLVFIEPEKALDIIKTIKKFDLEFKRKDLYVDVTIDNGEVTFVLEGLKHRFRESTPCTHESSISFRINPSFFEDVLLLSNRILYDSSCPYIAIEVEGGHMFTWIEK